MLEKLGDLVACDVFGAGIRQVSDKRGFTGDFGKFVREEEAHSIELDYSGSFAISDGYRQSDIIGLVLDCKKKYGLPCSKSNSSLLILSREFAESFPKACRSRITRLKTFKSYLDQAVLELDQKCMTQVSLYVGRNSIRYQID